MSTKNYQEQTLNIKFYFNCLLLSMLHLLFLLFFYAMLYFICSTEIEGMRLQAYQVVIEPS